MPYPVFRISSFGKDQRYGKQRETGESFGIYHAVGGVRHRLRKCVEIPVDVRAKWRWQLYADLSSVSGHPGNPGSCVGIFHRKSGSDKSPSHVPKIVKPRTEMGDFRLVLSAWQHCPDGILHCCLRLDHLLFCTVSQR